MPPPHGGSKEGAAGNAGDDIAAHLEAHGARMQAATQQRGALPLRAAHH
jgi:hypothetical protein